MGKTISNKNFLRMRFETAEFDGPWLRAFGKPELRGSWLIYGDSGSGKTTFNLQLAKYLTRFGRVAYNTLEQGECGSFQSAWKSAGMEEAGNRIAIKNKMTLAELRADLLKRRSADIVFIDSLHYWLRFKMNDYMNLLQDFPGKHFIFIAHEKAGEPKGDMAKYIRYNSDVKIHTEHFKAFVTTRFADPKTGDGTEDYVIWEEGANKYWLDRV